MIPVCLYFQVHQPHRLRRYTYFDVGREHRYFDDEANRAILARVAERSYRPATAMLERLLAGHPRFAVAFSLSGTLLEQLAAWEPDVLAAFRRLAAAGSERVEILAETSHHSLAWLASLAEFDAQVDLHRAAVAEVLGREPRVFRNTELIYSDALAAHLEKRGYGGVLADGVEPLTGPGSARGVFRASTPGGLPLLLRDYRLSDDIAFRFSNRTWSEWPLTPEKYDRWFSRLDGDLVSLFMDFETFGEHQPRETGIFEFFEAWVARHLAHSGDGFLTPSAAIAGRPRGRRLSSPRTLSWADEARDLSAWQGNDLQRDGLKRLFALEPRIRAAGAPDLFEDFRRLTTSDHFYYMATKAAEDGAVHAYFSPHESPYEAYIAFMHVLSDLERRLPHPARRPSAAAAPGRAPARL
jgi:alpha-amylase